MIPSQSNLQRFKSWYSGVLDGLYPNENAGFVILIVTFPLLERYLREKSGVRGGDLADPFYHKLRAVLPALPDISAAKNFWQVYRNGLLHQVTFSQQNRRGLRMPRSSLSGDADAVTIDQSGEFCVHPVKFARTVVEMIEADFSTFEGAHSASHPLPIVDAHSHSTVVPSLSLSDPRNGTSGLLR